MKEREVNLSELTEDMARLAARHQSLERFLLDSENALSKNTEEAATIDKKISESLIDLETVKNKWEMMLNFPVTNDKIFPFQTLSQEQLKEVKQDSYQELEIRVTPKGVWNEIMTLTVIAEK